MDVTSLAADIAAFIRHGTDEAKFNALALRLFAYQYENNAPYQRFCNGRGVSPETARTWRDIPATPASAFKRHALTCTPTEDCTIERGGRTFHSSGTTGAETSRHFLDAAALKLYQGSLRAGYRSFVLPEGKPLPVLALMSPPEEAPHSSLSFMLGELVTDDGGGFFVGEAWQERLAARLRTLTEPIVLFGTAFALIHFFDAISERFALPVHSRIVETGGFKGRSREVPREELYNLFTERLGVPPSHCLSEYGMSEMASQFYDSALYDTVHTPPRSPRKIGPFWLRTRILDPVTGQEAAPGQPGLLAHYDLANLNSVFAIQTEDYGYAEPDGHGFTLLGRAPGAILRGCSLTAEELAASA
jgi:hypothetical protein